MQKWLSCLLAARLPVDTDIEAQVKYCKACYDLQVHSCCAGFQSRDSAPLGGRQIWKRGCVTLAMIRLVHQPQQETKWQLAKLRCQGCPTSSHPQVYLEVAKGRTLSA